MISDHFDQLIKEAKWIAEKYQLEKELKDLEEET